MCMSTSQVSNAQLNGTWFAMDCEGVIMGETCCKQGLLVLFTCVASVCVVVPVGVRLGSGMHVLCCTCNHKNNKNINKELIQMQLETFQFDPHNFKQKSSP